MKFLILFLSFLIISFPAIAQEDSSRESDPCERTDTEFGMYDCINTQYTDIENLLIKTYKQAVFRLKNDARKARNRDGKEIEKRIDLLETSHKNWMEYRETACMAETFNEKEETKQYMKMRLCYMRISQRRLEDIQNFYELWYDKDYKNRPSDRTYTTRKETEGHSVTKKERR